MTEKLLNQSTSIREKLRRYRQEHLLNFFDQLDSQAQIQLLNEIDSIDFPFIKELIDRYVLNEPQLNLPDEIIPAPMYPAIPESDQREKYQQACQLGRKYIAAGKVAVFTVAGGMGTRLKIDGPKGNVAATPVKNKTLFRVFAEGIVATQKRYNCTVPWYIMTSPANHDDTVRSFEQNSYFGLDPANVIHFPQGMMPSFDTEGKILLREPNRLALSPDGHGGSLRALYRSGALRDMARRGIEHMSYFQIDNPLVYAVDPLFIGLHVLDGAEMSSKAVLKCDPLERVGNFACVNGRVNVIEYSDLPEDMARKKRDDGRLLFEAGSIAIHIISRRFVEKINDHGFSLPWHRAQKQVPFVDMQGTLVHPTKPNAIKLETFVFDALPLADRSIILEIDRSEQFAPIKNASGVDSLETSQKLQVQRAARWLEQADIPAPRKADGSPDVNIEISPLFALDPDELEQKRDQIPVVHPGDTLYLE